MNPYLHFTSGDCQAAFAHYQQALGASLVFSHTWADSPMADQAPGGDGSKIMHATLRFPDGTLLMGADCPPEYGTPFGGFALSVNAKDVAGRAQVRRDFRRRQGDDAAGEDLLGGTLRHVRGPLRRQLDGQLRDEGAGLTG